MTSSHPFQGRIAVVTNKSSPHYQEKVVIQRVSKSGLSFQTRAVEETLRLEDRLIFDSKTGKVVGVRAKHRGMRFARSSLRVTLRTTTPYVKGWEKETCALFTKYEGKTLAQVRRIRK